VHKHNENEERHSLEGRCLKTNFIIEIIHVTLGRKCIPRGLHVLLALHNDERRRSTAYIKDLYTKNVFFIQSVPLFANVTEVMFVLCSVTETLPEVPRTANCVCFMSIRVRTLELQNSEAPCACFSKH